MKWFRGKLSLMLLILQIIFIIIFGTIAEYKESEAALGRYDMIQDVHVMIFIGFGFLMTFLKRYGFSSVSFNLLLSAVGIQWAMIVRNLIEEQNIDLSVQSMLTGDFAIATVLISFGAVLGKTSPLQLIVMLMIEIPLAQVNEYIGLHKFHAYDVGESMYIHTFGAYFGLAVARVLYNDEIELSNKESSVYHSDLFSMVGTIFLWAFWPSFNSAAAADEARQNAILNTLLSLCACTVIVFAASSAIDKKGKLDMVHIQNSTLAGGVVVGACADILLQPYAAMIAGCLVGLLSVVGFVYIQPFLLKYLKIHDTCGVNNLHGMPGIAAGIIAAVVAATSEKDTHKLLGDIYTIRKDPASSDYRTAIVQGGFQIAALCVTLVIAIVGGVLTGLILKLPIWNEPDDLFEDELHWKLLEEPVPRISNDNRVTTKF
ncbi:ammonium transporter Rh type C-like [Octopus sinensis]|uniref:Ammonium transporter Rh type C-like n=1 Tax=Octopus sinensis TaxID=2607531 RepID=A0A6P7T9I2_9MOLL|nr:ammonium transporter Rh type C-like [Octopus sinensis]XP_036366695.1 ammonium transporter Rh type C-like [Octopus sinensis]